MSDDALPANFSRVQEVANRIRSRVLRERIAAGSHLGTKSELARRYGVSLGTLNSALRVLQSQNITESRPGVGGGVFVARTAPYLQLASLVLSLREGTDVPLLENVYIARTQLDVLLTGLAARARTNDDMRALQESLSTMRERRGDVRSTWDLHDCIAQAAHSPVLLSVYRTLVQILDEAVSRAMEPSADARNARVVEAHLARHAELVDSILAQDAERATSLAEDHARRIRPNVPGRPLGVAPPDPVSSSTGNPRRWHGRTRHLVSPPHSPETP